MEETADPTNEAKQLATSSPATLMLSTADKSEWPSDSDSSSDEWENENDDFYFYPSDNESFYSTTTVEAMCTSKPVVTTLSARWGRLLKTKEWSDCKFVIANTSCNQECQPKEFECHRLVLASCSRVFGAMLLGGMAETSKIVLQDESSETFSLLLEFAYTGELRKCNFSEAVQLYIAADKYQVLGLDDICEDAMCKELRPENLCEAFHLSEQYGLNKLKDFSIRMLQDRTKDVISSPAFKDFSLDILLLLVCQDQLSVESEQQLSEAVMQWSVAQLEDEQNNREVTDIEEENKVVKESKPEKLETSPDTNQNNIGSKSKEIEKNQKLRSLLGHAFKHIRFLVPSFKFETFMEKYPGILTNEEIFGIRLFRESLNDKESWHDLMRIFRHDHLSPTLHNEYRERLLPIKSKYKNKYGKSVKLKHCDLVMCDRSYNRDIEYEMNGESGDYFDCAFYLIPDHDITLHGIRVPSQVDPCGKFPLDTTYEENIVVEVTKLGDCTRTNGEGEKILYEKNRGGRICFKEIVPYNSTLDIMFPVPFRMFDAFSFEIKVEFNVAGIYPTVQTSENTPRIGGVTLHFKQLDSIGKMCLIKGVIFESRDKNPPRMNKWELMRLYEIESESGDSLAYGGSSDSELDEDDLDW